MVVFVSLSACALKTTLRSALRPRARPAAAEAHGVFDLAALAVKLASPQGVHDVLAEVHALCVAQQPGAAVAAVGQLRQLHHCLGRHLPVLKQPPMDMHRTLVQLASQEPAGSRLLREAEAALQNLHLEIIEWVNKPVAPPPCVMEIREHSGEVYAVAISPDGKWIASGSDDTTIKIVEMATGRVKCTLRGHSKDNPECTCKHGEHSWEIGALQPDPQCPVWRHRFVPFPCKNAFFCSLVLI